MPVIRNDFAEHASRMVRHAELGAGGVLETRMTLAQASLAARATLVSSNGLTFVSGENAAYDDLELHGEHDAPIVALHAVIRGSATLRLDGLPGPIAGTAGMIALYAAPSGRATVSLQARVTNQAFRIVFSSAKVHALADRYEAIAPLARSIAEQLGYIRWHSSPVDVRPWIAEILESRHLGVARPMFLEARALDWLATLLAVPEARPPERLPRREVDRVYEARDILLARSAEPPRLVDLAAAVGTNEFTLKRNFKLVLGQPPYAFLLAHRLDHARRLLTDTDQSIKEIAAAVGYAHASHFSTAFRRHFGITPWQHRDAAKRCTPS